MKIDLTGRIALVTGSTAGIGKAIAAMLVRAGAEVIVNGINATRVSVVRVFEATGQLN
jgi:NAD(P)-dependent dehydrogenase (short-subunit alcohol dehydrogenase family)